MWRNDIVFAVLAFFLVFISGVLLAALQIFKSQKRKQDFTKRKAFVRDSIRRRSKTIEKFNIVNENGSVKLKNFSSNYEMNFTEAPQPEMVTGTETFAQKWKENKRINTTETIVNSYIGSKTIYETCSSASLQSDFCNAQTHICCSSESVITPSKTLKQIKKNDEKKSGRDFDSDFLAMQGSNSCSGYIYYNFKIF